MRHLLMVLLCVEIVLLVGCAYHPRERGHSRMSVHDDTEEQQIEMPVSGMTSRGDSTNRQGGVTTIYRYGQTPEYIYENR